MATPRADMKGFFKQKKKGNTGISKSSPKGSRKNTPSPSTRSDVVQSPSLVSNHQDEYDQNEEVLRQFDMNMAYGPCIGMTRLDRWSRATKLGLNPPRDVGNLLTSDMVRSESLWDGRV